MASVDLLSDVIVLSPARGEKMDFNLPLMDDVDSICW